MNYENRSSGDGSLGGYSAWKSPSRGNGGVGYDAGMGEARAEVSANGVDARPNNSMSNNNNNTSNNNVDGNAWSSRSIPSASHSSSTLIRRPAAMSNTISSAASSTSCPPPMSSSSPAACSSPAFLPSAAPSVPVGSSPVASGYFHSPNVMAAQSPSAMTTDATVNLAAGSPTTASARYTNTNYMNNNNNNHLSGKGYNDAAGSSSSMNGIRVHPRNTHNGGVPAFPIAPTGLHRRGDSSVSSERVYRHEVAAAPVPTTSLPPASHAARPPPLRRSHGPRSSVSDTSTPGRHLLTGPADVGQGSAGPSFVSYTPQGFDPAAATTASASANHLGTPPTDASAAAAAAASSYHPGVASFGSPTHHNAAAPFVQPSSFVPPSAGLGSGLPMPGGSGLAYGGYAQAGIGYAEGHHPAAAATTMSTMPHGMVGGVPEMPIHSSARHLMGDSTVPLHRLRGGGRRRHRAGRAGALFRLLHNVFMHDVAGMEDGKDEAGGESGGGPLDREGRPVGLSRPLHQIRFGNPADDLPLLEELGVVPRDIVNKALAVLNPFAYLSARTLHDTDLAGPAVFAIALAFLLSLQGKMQFSAIYGLCVLGVLMFKALLSLMHDTSVPLQIIMSSLGYALIPNLLLAALRAAQFWIYGSACRGLLPLALFVILWSSWCATTLIVQGHDMISQRYLILYPMVLFYAVFAALTIF